MDEQLLIPRKAKDTPIANASMLVAIAIVITTFKLAGLNLWYTLSLHDALPIRSEERRVGKECMRTSDYMGAGNNLIELAVENGQARPLDFFWKLVLTALTMRAGFRGGEIVPSFCIGATFGCIMGHLIGLSPSICAAAGMAALFCGVTNCPITSILIAFELFGFRGASYYLIAVSISYAVSGYYGLYKDQTIVYSKYKAKYINRHTRF